MRAIIVGGGIGGLATARGLGLRGWEVTVLERQPRLEAAGAGLSLWPNALRALDWLGIGEAVRAAGAPITGGGLRAAGGAWLTRTGVSGPIGVHRADLHEILAEGLSVRTGTAVTDPHSLDADLIVGADGIRSAVRAAYAPQIQLRDSGQVSWRSVVPADALGDDRGGGETMGPGGLRFGYVPVGLRGVYWYVAAPAPLRTTAPAEQLAELRAAFEGWHEPIPRLLAATDPGALLHHPLLDLHPVAPMRFGERVALVGDAAHAMTPNLGQGACQALEDAVTLAALVPGGRDGGSVQEALREYDEIRRPRVAMVARRSWQVGRVAGARGAVTGRLVRALARLTPASATIRSAERVAAWEPPTATPALTRAGGRR
ncbi:FAD-dependent oxidoreductase [Dactylosporangium sp. NPDC051484]|uniref:FAD-dependent oxidoreductase n=1 Tax=Dactylosporangium sp. NPDC051484 TaxID=3154942 RepID=UPI00344DF721